jgi:hypothetical protein
MSHKIYGKPSLDAESFQSLLAAAFILQSRAEWIARKPVRTVDAKRFAARAIAQKPTRPIRPSLARPGAWGEADAVSRFSGPMLWKTVEALAIASVFCLMMGISIHHLLADPRGSSPAEMLQTRDAGRLTSSTPQVLLKSALASQQPDATQKSRQSQDDGEGELNTGGEDLVIHYRPRTANLPGLIGKATTRSSALAQSDPRQNTEDAALVTEKVVEYGDDVTMWSSLKRPSLVQSGKASSIR